MLAITHNLGYGPFHPYGHGQGRGMGPWHPYGRGAGPSGFGDAPPSAACSTGTQPDPSTGAAIDPATNACACPNGTGWDEVQHQCTAAALVIAPSAACATGTQTDPSTGAALNTNTGYCECPPSMMFDPDAGVCSVPPPTPSAADVEAQARAQYAQQAATCDPNMQYWDWTSKSCVTFPSTITTAQQKAAVVAVQQQKAAAAAVAAAPKKFWDVKNPMMWAAIAGGVILVGGVSFALRRPRSAAVPAGRGFFGDF